MVIEDTGRLFVMECALASCLRLPLDWPTLSGGPFRGVAVVFSAGATLLKSSQEDVSLQAQH